MKSFLPALILLLLTQAPAFADAYFFSEAELVQRSTAIAIIDLDAPTPTDAKGKPFHYRQVAHATTVELISGELPTVFQLHGGETFICAQCTLAKGRYLAFLTKKDNLWAGTNWHLSLRPIKDGKTEWYAKRDQRHPLEFQDSATVLNRVRTLLAAKKPS